jgi:hypothetical protein
LGEGEGEGAGPAMWWEGGAFRELGISRGGEADVVPQVEKLAQTAYDVGSSLLKPVRSEGDEDEEANGAGAAKAVEWLLWALELLEQREGEVVKTMQVSRVSVVLSRIRPNSVRRSRRSSPSLKLTSMRHPPVPDGSKRKRRWLSFS